MAEIDRTNSRDPDTPPQTEHAADRAAPPSLGWLPHNFDGWGPKTLDADGSDAMPHADSQLTWNGIVGDRDHHVWTFQRAGRRHH